MCNDKLYAIAMQCAKLSDSGCACQCGVCQFNVFNYVSDVREASLLKANAYTDYYRAKESRKIADRGIRAQQFGPMLLIAIIVLAIMYACNGCVTYNYQPTIESVLDIMNSRVIRDVNNDGLINCIDYSLTFRSLYGPDARVITNINMRTGMNHMFIIVDGIEVEPQGTSARYDMQEIWGPLYNRALNMDVSYKY